jgi:predicted nucleic acid-binding protein
LSASFDNSIIIYAFTAGPKQAAARNVMADGGFISVQVLNEFVNGMRKSALSHGRIFTRRSR